MDTFERHSFSLGLLHVIKSLGKKDKLLVENTMCDVDLENEITHLSGILAEMNYISDKEAVTASIKEFITEKLSVEQCINQILKLKN